MYRHFGGKPHYRLPHCRGLSHFGAALEIPGRRYRRRREPTFLVDLLEVKACNNVNHAVESLKTRQERRI
jgi:hypothetical protein